VTDLGGFIALDGRAQIPFAGAERIAMAFAAAEPDSVMMTIDAEAEELRAQGYDVGERYWHDELRKRRPAFAVARQWAGFEAETARLQAEVQRLRNLLGMAISDLRAADLRREAGRLERLMDGR
jgi:hypothetical protein